MEITRGYVGTSFGLIHYRARPGDRDGPRVLVMHINQRSSAFYPGLMAELAKETGPIVAFDHLGHGGSDPAPDAPSMADYAACAAEVAAGLGWDRYVVIGEAVSALVAVELAVSEPERVERLVLVNCPSWEGQGSRTTDLQGMRAQRPADDTGWPLTRTLEFVLEHDPEHAPYRPTQEWMDLINRAQMEVGRERWKIVDAMEAYDVGARVGAVSCPTLAVWGEHFLYAVHRESFGQRLPGIEHATIPDGRFDLCWEHPGPVAAAIHRSDS